MATMYPAAQKQDFMYVNFQSFQQNKNLASWEVLYIYVS